MKNGFRTYDQSSEDKSRNQIDLTFYGAKRIPADVLAGESRLSVDECNKLAVVFSIRTSRKGEIRLHSFSKVKRSDG